MKRSSPRCLRRSLDPVPTPNQRLYPPATRPSTTNQTLTAQQRRLILAPQIPRRDSAYRHYDNSRQATRDRHVPWSVRDAEAFDIAITDGGLALLDDAPRSTGSATGCKSSAAKPSSESVAAPEQKDGRAQPAGCDVDAVFGRDLLEVGVE